jgi:hypothetical protein
MRKITRQSTAGDIEIEISDQLIEIIARRSGIDADSVSSEMLFGFFKEASNIALDRAAAEYVTSDGKDT